MYLNKILIINQKSCRDIVVSFEKDKPTTLIGKNDSGKSVILNSIGCILGNQSIKTGTDTQITSDISNTPIPKEVFDKHLSDFKLPLFEYDEKSAYVLADLVFEDSDISDDFNKKASSLLKWSIEGSNNSHVFIIKQYKKGEDAGKYYICTRDTDDNLSLWSKTQADLTALLKNYAVSEDDIKNDNAKGRFSNLEKFRAIYNKLKVEFKWTPYADFLPKKDGVFFPTYRYIDWKTSLKEIEALAKDAVSTQIDVHKAKLVEQAKTISEEINKIVNDDLVSKSDSIFEDNENLKKLKIGVSFSVEESVSDLIIEKHNSDGDINLESQGEGVKRQIMFAILKWASLNSIEETSGKKFVWCFDEPEVHLYPTAQRELFEAIKELSKDVFQIVLSTHSTVFINRQDIKSINHLSLKNGYSILLKTDSVEDVHFALGVQNSDILFFDKFVGVEGSTEFTLLPHLYKLITGKTLYENSIQLINLGGKDQWSNNKSILENLLSDFKDSGLVTHFILDSDSGVVEDNVYLIGTCDIEDSLSDEIWISIIKDLCEVDITKDELSTLRSNLDCSQKNKKFHKLLGDLVNSKNPTNYLPSKGEDLANILIQKINKVELIPKKIKEAIEKISPSN